MKQNLLKNTLMAGLAVCVLSGCSSLMGGEDRVEETTTVQSASETVVYQPICSSENQTNCIVTFEEPDLKLAQAYNGYAVSTAASYQTGSAPVSLSAPAVTDGISVKDRLHQRELAQQRADLALQPVPGADIVCSGPECSDALFKTQIEKTIQTKIIQNGEQTTVGVTGPGVGMTGTIHGVSGVPVNGGAQVTGVVGGVPVMAAGGSGALVDSAVMAEPVPNRLSPLQERIAFGETVHDWDAPAGQSLRTLLLQWGEQSGWTVVWKLDRDYNLEAGVVFRGRFTEVAAAFIRSFARATPAPIGTFYKGNRVLVINTQENDNAE